MRSETNIDSKAGIKKLLLQLFRRRFGRQFEFEANASKVLEVEITLVPMTQKLRHCRLQCHYT